MLQLALMTGCKLGLVADPDIAVMYLQHVSEVGCVWVLFGPFGLRLLLARALDMQQQTIAIYRMAYRALDMDTPWVGIHGMSYDTYDK